jgi:hypothetical protein
MGVSKVLYYLAKPARANPALSIAITQSSLRGINIKRQHHPPKTLERIVAFVRFSYLP